MNKRFNIILLAAFCLWLPIAAAAQDYHVEMLFFARTDPGAVLAEYWPNEGPEPSIEQAVDLGQPQAAGFSSQSSSTFNLATAREILEESSQYEVIEHVAWQQPGLSESEAKPVHIQAGPDYSSMFPTRPRPEAADPRGFGNTPPVASRTGPLLRLNGTVKVVLGRYLHVYTDLVYRQPTESAGGERLVEARVRQERRMKSGDLHYLDHPLLGILVQITPVE